LAISSSDNHSTFAFIAPEQDGYLSSRKGDLLRSKCTLRRELSFPFELRLGHFTSPAQLRP
jgi:hypothetical protein